MFLDFRYPHDLTNSNILNTYLMKLLPSWWKQNIRIRLACSVYFVFIKILLCRFPPPHFTLTLCTSRSYLLAESEFLTLRLFAEPLRVQSWLCEIKRHECRTTSREVERCWKAVHFFKRYKPSDIQICQPRNWSGRIKMPEAQSFFVRYLKLKTKL